MTNGDNPLIPDKRAAHEFLAELRTRIAIQPLPYQYGVEVSALESLHALFSISRTIIKENPGCEEFARITIHALNIHIRPVTAKWHKAYELGVLKSKDGANDFRIDLGHLQKHLRLFALDLQIMAYGKATPDELTPPVMSKEAIDECFLPVKFGINTSQGSSISNATDINQDELNEINARRKAYSLNSTSGQNAVGLALSGGGIRSATFCLGVIQILVKKNLLKDIDYLSTVSGGGFIGGLVTSIVGSNGKFEDIGHPYGPDTSTLKHVRNNAKYLSSWNLAERWKMVVELGLGMLLNSMVVLGIISMLAIFSTLMRLFDIPILLFLIIGFGSFSLFLFFLYGLFINNERLKANLLVYISYGTLATTFIAGLSLIDKVHEYFVNNLIFSLYLLIPLGLGITLVPAITRLLPIFGKPSLKRIYAKFSLWAIGLIVPIFSVIFYYALLTVSESGFNSLQSLYKEPLNQCGLLYVFGFTVFAFILAWRLNVNQTSLHSIYKSRLAKTFIKNPTNESDSKLQDINMSQRAPYHLINATVNLPSSRNLGLRDRKSDFYIFSKYWSGSLVTGYKRNSKTTNQIDLSTAIAISGAAASPHMGARSKPTLSALLSLLNIRLGYWIANQSKNNSKKPGAALILKEMTGSHMDEKSKWQYLTDGGHIENMGVYELLRRRCKYIICVDGESDPTSTFEGKLTLVRHAQIDFGIKLEPRLDDVRLNPESKFSKSHIHLMRIIYPAVETHEKEEIGLMLYVKLSLTGDEAELLKRYRMINPEFPHQSTIDQFYDEEQFEVYRQLGVHVAEGTFSPAILTSNNNPSSIEDWFRQLVANMLEPYSS